MKGIRPYNFSWVIKDKLSASGLPRSEKEVLWLAGNGIDIVIYLVEEYPPIEDWYSNVNIELIYFPIPDYHPPTISQAREIVDRIEAGLRNNKVIHTCCRSGIGRAPTVLSMFLTTTGLSPQEAIEQVATRRNGWGYGTQIQRNSIYQFVEQFNNHDQN